MKLNKIMKKTILATMAVLMATSLSFTGCSNGDDDPTPGLTPAGSDDIVLFEDANGWSEDWTAKEFTSDKFTSANVWCLIFSFIYIPHILSTISQNCM